MDISPTAGALLGLLALRPWTTYELAQQAERSLRFFFPRAERHLYAEARRLADAGYATAEATYTGKRRGTRYAITDEGRAVLGEWLRTSPAPMFVEAEAVLRTFFADSGTLADVRASLEAARAQAIEAQRELATLADTWLDGAAPFPERGSLGALSMRFVVDFHRLVEGWADWALAETATWDDGRGAGWAGRDDVFRDVAGGARPD